MELSPYDLTKGRIIPPQVITFVRIVFSRFSPRPQGSSQLVQTFPQRPFRSPNRQRKRSFASRLANAPLPARHSRHHLFSGLLLYSWAKEMPV